MSQLPHDQGPPSRGEPRSPSVREATGTPPDAGAHWPAARVEPRPWTTNPDQTGRGGARPNYDDRMLTEIRVEIPVLLGDIELRLPAEAVALAEQATNHIVRLDAGVGRNLAPLSEFLLRSESVASSRIEHVYTDLDDLARATLGEEASSAARSTMSAYSALSALTSSCDGGAPLTEEAVLDAHHALLGQDRVERQFAGRYRTQQNWIGGSDFTPRTAVHIPPPHIDVPALMGDLVSFANRDDMPAITQAAIVHAQFEAIHPFTDGNGRVGRALISAVLRRRELASQSVVPVASVMLSDVDMYFERLRDYRRGDVGAMVRYLAESSIIASEAAEESAARLLALPSQWHDRLVTRRGSSSRVLVDGLLAHPVLDVRVAGEVTGASRPRTYDAIDALVEASVLSEITGGGRNRVWVASDVLTEMDALTERIGYRARPSPRWADARHT